MELRHKIQVLLDSDITGAEVAKGTGIDQAKYSRLKNGHNAIGDLTLKTAERLGELYDKRFLTKDLTKDNEGEKMDLRHKIQSLLDSKLSGYEVEKITGVNQGKFRRLRNGTNSLDNISIKTAERLGKLYDAVNLDMVVKGDEIISTMKSVLGRQFNEILSSQLEMATGDEAVPDDIRTYNVLHYIFNLVLHDNDMLIQVAPYFMKDKLYHSPYETD